MLNILARSSVFWITHICTFSMGLAPLLHAQRRVPMLMTLFLPLWMTSSVLWSERNESYAFLRMLPVTDRRIVHLKFGLALGALLAYAAILSCAGILSLDPGEALEFHFKMVTLSCAVSLLLAGACFIGMWALGPTVMTVVILAFDAANLVAGILVATEVKRSPWIDIREIGVFRLLDARPLDDCWLVATLALVLFWGLSELGILVKGSRQAYP